MRAIDFKNAYLNADMNDDVLMVLPNEIAERYCKIDHSHTPFLRKDGTLLVKLDKTLYGCRQSSALWYDKLTHDLKQLGFAQNSEDKCVWSLMLNGSLITVLFHVDDVLDAKTRQTWIG